MSGQKRATTHTFSKITLAAAMALLEEATIAPRPTMVALQAVMVAHQEAHR